MTVAEPESTPSWLTLQDAIADLEEAVTLLRDVEIRTDTQHVRLHNLLSAAHDQIREVEDGLEEGGDRMPVIAKDPGGGNFILAPEGLHICVCCDVYPLGLITTVWNGKKRTSPKILVAWQTEDTIKDEEAATNGNPDIAGKPYLITKRYTLSLHENAALRKDLQRWRGKAFTPDELSGFDVEKLVGVPCQIQVIHNRGSNDRTYANVDGILRAPAGTLISVRDYTRKKDRPDWEEPNMQMPGRGETSNASSEDDDLSDIPF